MTNVTTTDALHMDLEHCSVQHRPLLIAVHDHIQFAFGVVQLHWTLFTGPPSCTAASRGVPKGT